MPRSWNLKRFLGLDTKQPDVKYNDSITSESAAVKTDPELKKKKRKAPDIPVEPKSKFAASDKSIRENSNISSPLSINQRDPLNESASSSSTDYSPSSQSFTISSMSGSIETLNHSENASLELPKYPMDGENKLCKNEKAIITEDDHASSDVGDYVEKALLDNSNNDLKATCADKSAELLNDNSTPHHPPRLTSFESSNMLHQKGLSSMTSSSPLFDNCLKAHYVTLDYVKSAAAEKRQRSSNDDDEASGGSSLSSSFMMTVDSEVESTIGSDVVDLLYKNITNGKHNRRSSPIKSPEVKTGDIETDLFPLIFPGRNRAKESNDSSQQSISDSAGGLGLSSSAVDNHLSPNFNNNNRCRELDRKQSSVDLENPDVASEGNRTFSLQNNTFTCDREKHFDQCEMCSGVIINLDQTMDEETSKAKRMFGRCDCGPLEEQEAITELDYSSFNLEFVPVVIKDYRNSLTKLTLESNTISELTQEVFMCVNLEHLSVSDNDIMLLPPAVARLSKLKHLDISKNVIKVIPDCIRCLKNLEVFDTSVNPIEKLSEGFTQLINLREVYMNDCFFEFLPANFGRMTQLRSVELRDNQLQILPKSMRRLTSLSRLDLGGNAFQSWPDVLSKLTNLEHLWLDCNELCNISLHIGSLTRLKYLDLSRNFLESIPSQIGSLELLTDLVLAENTLTSLPESIGFLCQLNTLNLELNQIQILPDSLGKLRNLEEVDLSHNKLENLPSSVGRLKKLNTLLVDDNHLSEIPAELGQCSELSILHLSRNRIDELPATMGDLSELRVLNICQNRISHLPETFKKLINLEALWISPNQSKPCVPLASQTDPTTNCPILTNVLLPQKENGHSRVMQIFGLPDEDDEASYANDAADDDDLDAYAQREHGKSKVVFNFEANTYSDDVYISHEMDDDEELVNRDFWNICTFEELSSDNPSENNDVIGQDDSLNLEAKKAANTLSECNDSLESEKLAMVDTLKDYEIDATDAPSQSVPNHKVSPFSETHSEDEEKDDNVSLQSSGGLRTWSSRTNLPSALITTEEWNPDEVLSPIVSCTLKDEPKYKEEPIISKEIVTESTSISTSNPLNPSSTSSLLHLTSGSSVSCSSSLVLTASNTSSIQKSLDLNDIPFMDSDEEVEERIPGDTEASSLTSNDKNLVRQQTCSKSESNHTEDILSPYTSPKKEKISRKIDNTVETKSSSTTSSDALATDHDSGVGNDVESQESIPDPHEEASVCSNNLLKTSIFVADRKTETSLSVDSPSVRRNGGWIALVRTGPVQDEGDSAVSKEMNKDKPQFVSTVNHMQSVGNKSPLKTCYIPITTGDCTTVTYSQDYNKAKSRPRGSEWVSPSKLTNSNHVAHRIQKFENYSNNLEQTSNSHAFIEKPKSLRSVAPRSVAFNNSTSIFAATTANTTKPVAVATILPSSNRFLYKQEQTQQSVENTSVGNDSKINKRAISDLVSYANPEHEMVFSPTVHRVQNVHVQPPKEVSQVDEPFPARRIHSKRSKFDEALAATKHKHFRDVLGKMMQEHQTKKSVSEQNRRSSLENTSSLSRVTRITSPVPHQHSSLSNDQRTVVSPHSDKSRSLSNKNELKSVVHGQEKSLAKNQTSTIAAQVLSRNRPSSTRHSGKQIGSKRGSVKQSSKETRSTEVNQSSSKSLKERLGQLYLDGKENQLPMSTQHEAIKIHSSVLNTNASTGNSNTTTSGKPLPADWKQQLLLYLEQKKLASGNESLARKSQSQVGSLPNRSYVTDENRKYESKPLTSIKPNSTESKKKQNSPKSSQLEFFSRPSKSSNRRSSGRYQRTRTPGPELTSTDLKQSQNVMRPRSAMDLRSSSFDQVDPHFEGASYKELNKDKEIKTLSTQRCAPPSYEDHVLRRAHTMAAVWNKQEHHDYVNVEYIDQLRLSQRKKLKEHNSNYPLRLTGSHDSVLNAKERHQPDVESSIILKGSASHGSIPNNHISHDHHHDHLVDSRQEKPLFYNRSNRPPVQDTTRIQTGKSIKRSNDYGKIPTPAKTVIQYDTSRRRSTKHSQTPGLKTPDRNFDSKPSDYVDLYSKQVPPPSSAVDHGYGGKEEESMASAFRPYQHKNPIPQPQNEVFDDQSPSFFHPSYPHQSSRFKSNFYPQHHHPIYHHHYKRFHEQSLPTETKPYWRNTTDPGAELITVTIRKNPTFGFHIMGGIDVGGNPFRLDDDGVFITYVSPGGAADGLVQPGDKILLVNGSEFVGITHQRAVDLLRNAGLNAVVVVERLIGRPV